MVDDFQWIDPESRKILLFIARRVAAERIVLIIAVRDEPGFPISADNLPVTRLTGLGYDDCAELARQRRITIAPDSLRSLVQRSGGNPLVVLENLASAADPGGFPGDEKLVLHSSLDRVWGQVLRQLPAATQRALFVVAASHGAGSAGLGMVLGEVGLSLQSLQPAERRGLVRTADGGVRLCHPLLRSVVLNRTPLADRVQVYQALARLHHGRRAGLVPGRGRCRAGRGSGRGTRRGGRRRAAAQRLRGISPRVAPGG